MSGEQQQPDPRREIERGEEDYRALQASLEEYVRDRLAPLSEWVAERGAVDGGAGWFRRWRPEVYFALTAVALALIWWRLPVVPDRASGEQTRPAAAWDALGRQDPQTLAAWLTAVAEARGLGEGQISAGQKNNFAGWAETVRQGRALTRDELAAAGRGLFEYIYARRFQDPEKLARAGNQVDLLINPGEYHPLALAALLREADLARRFPAPRDPHDEALQAAVVGEWLNHRRP